MNIHFVFNGNLTLSFSSLYHIRRIECNYFPSLSDSRKVLPFLTSRFHLLIIHTKDLQYLLRKNKKEVERSE